MTSPIEVLVSLLVRDLRTVVVAACAACGRVPRVAVPFCGGCGTERGPGTASDTGPAVPLGEVVPLSRRWQMLVWLLSVLLVATVTVAAWCAYLGSQGLSAGAVR